MGLVTENKKRFLTLLLAGEQEEMTDRYPEHGALFALYDHGEKQSLWSRTRAATAAS